MLTIEAEIDGIFLEFFFLKSVSLVDLNQLWIIFILVLAVLFLWLPVYHTCIYVQVTRILVRNLYLKWWQTPFQFNLAKSRNFF